MQVAARSDSAFGPFRRVGHGEERACAQTQQQVRGDERVRERGVTVALAFGRGPSAGVLHHGGQPGDAVGAVDFARGETYDAADLFTPADQSSHQPALGVVNQFGLLARGAGEGDSDSVAA